MKAKLIKRILSFLLIGCLCISIVAASPLFNVSYVNPNTGDLGVDKNNNTVQTKGLQAGSLVTAKYLPFVLDLNDVVELDFGKVQGPTPVFTISGGRFQIIRKGSTELSISPDGKQILKDKDVIVELVEEQKNPRQVELKLNDNRIITVKEGTGGSEGLSGNELSINKNSSQVIAVN